MGVLFGLLSAVGWGSANFLAAKSSRAIGNVITLLYMLTIGCIVAGIYFLVTLTSYNFSGLLNWLPMLALIGLLQTVAYLALYKALDKGKAAIVTPITGAWSLITIALSILFLGEHLQSKQILAIVLIFSGITLLSINLKELIATKKISLLLGVKPSIVAMVSFGLSFFFLTPVIRDMGWFLPTFFYRLIALFWIISYVIIKRNEQNVFISNKYLLRLLPIGILDMGGFFAYSLGVDGSQGSIVAPLSATAALVTSTLAFFLLNERLSTLQIVGVISAVIGVIVMSA